jgi:hypothetical protein
MVLTREGSVVRQEFRTDDVVTDDRGVVYEGPAPEAWLHDQFAKYEADGWWRFG